jgi:hypothetical protein
LPIGAQNHRIWLPPVYRGRAIVGKIAQPSGVPMTFAASPVPTPLAPPAGRPPPDTAALRHLAEEMEAAFLGEMLGHAGLGESRESFGGGIGEEQFGSFLRQEQAAAMVRAGGIGLAESLFRALTEGRDVRA